MLYRLTVVNIAIPIAAGSIPNTPSNTIFVEATIVFGKVANSSLVSKYFVRESHRSKVANPCYL